MFDPGPEDNSSTGSDSDHDLESDGDDASEDQWVGFRWGRGPHIRKVKLLLRLGADPCYAVNGVSSQEILAQRAAELDYYFDTDLRLIRDAFDECIKERNLRHGHWVEKGNNFLSKKRKQTEEDPKAGQP